MKQKLFTLFATLLCSISMFAGGTKVVYTVFDEDTGTLTYYYDSNYNAVNTYHELYDPVNNPTAQRFTNYYDKVKKAIIDPSMKEAPLKSMYKMFYGGTTPQTSEEYSLTKMTTIEGLENLNTTQVTFMAAMFWNCFALKSLDFSSFDTSNVMFMTAMFYRCDALTSLDLTSFNISKVTDMDGMFAGCTALATIYCADDWSKSTTLTDSKGMFTGCEALVGGEGTAYNSSYTDATYARLDGGLKAPGYFTSKSKAKKVYTVFDPTKQTLTYRYDNDYYLSDPYQEVYDPINLHDAVRFTEYYDKVKKVVIDPSMKNAPLTSTRKMFQGGFNEDTNTSQCLTAMTTIEGLENLNTSKMTSLTMMFFKCPALKSVDLTSFDISKVTDMSHMFNGCSSLTTIYCNDDWSKSAALKDSKYMFADCTALVGGMGTPFNENVIDKTYARLDGGLSAPGYFTKERKVYTVYDEATQTLTYYYDSNYYLSDPYQELYDPINNPNALRFEAYHDQVKKAIIDPSMKEAPLKSMYGMFHGGHNSETNESYYLANMTTIEGLENLNTAIVTRMEMMFTGCLALKSLDLSTFNTAKVTTMRGMFYDCSGLTSLDLGSFNTAKVTNMGFMFDGCSGLTFVNLSSFNTSNVMDMQQMFDDCSDLTSIDLSSFDVSKVVGMPAMFWGCSKLTTIYCADDWSTSEKLAYSPKMFKNCFALVGGKGTAYNAEFIDKTYARPDGGPEAPGYFTKRDVYTVYNSKKKTLTYYFDKNYNSANPNHELYDPVNNPYAVRFADYHDQVKKAIIDPSMKEAPLKSMRNMFYGGYMGKNYSLSAMTSIEGLENLNTAIVTNMSQMFAACSALTSLDLRSFDTQNVTDMSSMFDNCSSLQTLNVNSFDIGNVTNMAGMFNCCSELTTIYCSNNWSNSEATSSYMFNACNKLVGGEGTPWSDAVMDKSYARPDGGPEAPGYFTVPALLKGDADCDGQVTSADIVAMTDYIMGNPPADFSKANADVNLDGVINIADIVAVSNILLNK